MEPGNSPFATTFPTTVPAKGFEWVEGVEVTAEAKTAAEVWLVAVAGKGKDDHFIIEDSLFEEFGTLAMDEGSIRRFANRFGTLGVEKAISQRERGRGSRKRVLVVAEKLIRWRNEILQMRAALELAAAVDGKDTKRIRAWIKIGEGSASFVMQDKKTGAFAQRSVKDSDIRPGRPSAAARIVLQSIVNKKLVSSSQVGIARDGESTRLLIFANSLLGVMWIQFADAMSQDRLRFCENCKELLVLLHGYSRRDKKTCSKTCSNALNYKARSRAKKKGR